MTGGDGEVLFIRITSLNKSHTSCDLHAVHIIVAFGFESTNSGGMVLSEKCLFDSTPLLSLYAQINARLYNPGLITRNYFVDSV